MPSNKIYAILVLCLGVVVSIWLLGKNPATAPVAQVGNVDVVTGNRNQDIGTSTDWQKILVQTSTGIQTSVVPKESASTFDDTTVTAQIAKDFFGQYLGIANKGSVSPDDANTIANNVLATPAYTQTTGALYIANNLHITAQTDTATVQKYFNALTQIIINRKINNTNDDPMAIVKQALTDNNENDLAKLDPMITQGRGVISDLVAIGVPSDAVKLHLALLNASSNMLSNLEAMRVTFNDPIRSFTGASQYGQHVLDLENALKNLQTYFKQKQIR